MADPELYPGSSIAPTVTFTSLATGLPADPDVIDIMVHGPDGTESTHTYGTDDNVVRVSEGVYQLKYVFPDAVGSAGEWTFRARATGTVDAATEKKIKVKKTGFTAP